jgi:hypothetical protein
MKTISKLVLCALALTAVTSKFTQHSTLGQKLA